MTDPKKILSLIKFASSALELSLITKDEVIDWADKIVTEEDAPDIFFIDLLLLNSKDKRDILSYLENILAFESVESCGRPLLSQLYKCFESGSFGLDKTIMILSSVKNYGTLSIEEGSSIYALDDRYDYDPIENVSKALTAFLSIYGGYSLFNYDEWVNLDKEVDSKLQLLDFDALI